LSLGNRIKEMRMKRGYTQEQLAEKVGMKRPNFANYEANRTIPPSDVIANLADILLTSTDYLLGKTKNPDPVNTELEFVADLELSDKELFERYDFKLDGREISEKEANGIIAFLRASRQLEQ
jgi:transcriptional regulator with XRE-family HTH domain